MTATTADLIPDERGSDFLEDEFAIATSATLYIGAHANFNTAGRLVDATAAASRTYAGLVIEPVNDSGSPLATLVGNSAGTVKARIRWNHEVKVAIRTSARTYTNLTKTVFVSDNQTADGTAAGTTLARVVMGQLASFTDSTKAYAYVKLTRTPGSASATG